MQGATKWRLWHLGWVYLGQLPIITRSVNGVPDESPSGFFNRVNGTSVKEKYAEFEQGNKTALGNLLSLARDYQTDTEPDIFYFNIGNKNGKFYWDQDKQAFLVSPLMNIKIAYSSAGFKITAQVTADKVGEPNYHCGPATLEKARHQVLAFLVWRILWSTQCLRKPKSPGGNRKNEGNTPCKA